MPAAQTALPFELALAGGEAAENADTAAPWDLPSLAGRLVEITSEGPGGRHSQGASRSRTSAIPSIWDIAVPRDAGSAVLTSAAGLLWKAQQRGEPAAWISARASSFYPPDLDAGGIDLAALVVVRAADASTAARAADKLLRSGAFGLVVLDLGAWAVVPAPLLSRLLGLAQKHSAAVVFLTEKAADAPSLGPVVSLRVTTSRRRATDQRVTDRRITEQRFTDQSLNEQRFADQRSAGQGFAGELSTGTGERANDKRFASDRFVCTITATKDKRRAPGWTCEETFRGPPGLR